MRANAVAFVPDESPEDFRPSESVGQGRLFRHLIAAANNVLRSEFQASDCRCIQSFVEFVLAELKEGRHILVTRCTTRNSKSWDAKPWAFLLYLLMRIKRGFPQKRKFRTSFCMKLVARMKPTLREPLEAHPYDFKLAASALATSEDFHVLDWD